MSDLVVIGGGAAGLFAAGFAAKGGASVTVLERGVRPARKLLITGKGRCNVTNNCSPEDFLRNVRTNPRFLYGAASAFSPADAMAFFESLGVPLKTERGGRVIPGVRPGRPDVAGTRSSALRRRSGARLVTSARVTDILAEDGGVRGVRLEDGRELSADAVLVATGGCSYPATGSTGDGWRLAKALGHMVVPARASLVPVRAKETWCAELMGLSLKNVTLTLRDARGKAVFSELGEMLFTHFGVSGPLVLSASSYLAGDPGGFRMEIDLKPGLDDRQLDARLLRDFSAAEKPRLCKRPRPAPAQKAHPGRGEAVGHPARPQGERGHAGGAAGVRRAFKGAAVTPAGLLPSRRGGHGGRRGGPGDRPAHDGVQAREGALFRGGSDRRGRADGGLQPPDRLVDGPPGREGRQSERIKGEKRMISIAIDGPAGAGKSTIARAIAKELGYIYVDTGALYRAIGLYANANGVATDDPAGVERLLGGIKVELRYKNGEQRVFLNGYDVSEEIRRPEVSMAASNVSAIPAVRQFLFALQQNMAVEHDVVMDGRDIGTIVLPGAQVKIFLTASPRSGRARRYDELKAKGHDVDYDALLEEVRQRDYNDSHRAIAQLKQADDALLVDTTGNTLEQSVQVLTKLVKERLRDVL